MNISLGTFMKIAATAVVIVALIFGVAYNLISGEADYYGTKVEEQRVELNR